MSDTYFGADEVWVGRDIGGREITVSPALIARYEEGTGDRHAWYREESPFGGPVAPALLFHSEVFRDLSWYLPNLIGNLHARQEWELFAPMPVGATVRTRSTVVDRYRKRDREYVVNEVVITDRAGRWLQRSRTHQSFLIERPEGMAVDRAREKRPDRQFDLGPETGQELPGFRRTVTLAMCQAFSGPQRNYHNDPEMARALGFPEVVVQGMLSVCFVSELMTRAFGAGWYLGGKLDVRLVNIVWGGETVETGGRIEEVVPEGRRERARVRVWCRKPEGTVTLVGTASALCAGGS